MNNHVCDPDRYDCTVSGKVRWVHSCKLKDSRHTKAFCTNLQAGKDTAKATFERKASVELYPNTFCKPGRKVTSERALKRTKTYFEYLYNRRMRSSFVIRNYLQESVQM